ncbi:FecR family protein [Ensifer adhaerens]|uniref:FecR family protein n=1 Tax=Ensifer adhaerens TaxID=106592 RepID=UPI000CF0D789|nr:FecR domain-containing protein [Ensifer adhaerens]
MSDPSTLLPRDKSQVEKEAVAWFTRMNGKPTQEDAQDFERWLGVSQEHRAAFEDVGSLWVRIGSAGRPVEQQCGELAGPLQRIERQRRRRRMEAGTAASSILAAVLATWLWLDHPNFVQDYSADYVAARGERRTIVLSDGSSVLLDADTAIDSVMSADERRIRVLRGAVSLKVQPSSVPFVVEAGDGTARVLGTEFDVALDRNETVAVTLSSGSVVVAVDGQPHEVRLNPGEEVDYGKTGLGTARKVDLETSTAWHEGRYIFTNERLDNVLDKIGRYRKGRIVLLGSALGARRVSGNVSLADPNAALAAVQASVGMRVTRVGERLVLVGP